MDACLDTLSTEMYQVKIRVSRIARWQVVMGGFISETSPPTPEAYKDEDDDNDATAFEDEDDGDASSFGTDEMSP